MADPKNETENPTEAPVDERSAEQRMEITGVLLIGFALLSLIAIFFDGAGFIGEIVKRGLFYSFGQRGSLIPLILLGVFGVSLLGWRRGLQLTRHFIALILLCLWALLIIHIFSGFTISDSTWNLASEGGGVVGHFFSWKLIQLFGKLGTAIFLLIWLVVAVILALDRPLVLVILGLITKRKIRAIKAPEPEKPVGDQDHHEEVAVPKERKADNVVYFPSRERPSRSPVVATLQNMLKEKEQNLKLDGPVAQKQDTKQVQNLCQLPDPKLLGSLGGRPKKAPRVVDQSRQLEETLSNFGIQAKVIEVHHGPAITRYDLQPAPGVKVSRIVNLTDDLALALAAKGLRLEAPIPGKAAIGVEVPNHEIQVVTFQEVIESKLFWSSGKLSFTLGVDIAGEVVMADLRKMPHLLIAGATGSGKSVCVNTLIMSILFKALPDEVKFIMIDPKMVELSIYNGIPHLMAPVVTEAKYASGVLKLVVDEMERRYKLFAEARVRDLEKYNDQLPEEEVLPYIVVLIDELADLMMIAPVEVEDSICRLAQMARATGIHLVVATQRPSVDVITGLIKANIPSRIAFAVSSQVDSRTILDCQGAERLLGRGDMLFLPVGAMKPRRIQGALVTEKEIEAVIKHWKIQGEPDYQEQFLNVPANSKDSPIQEEDDLFWDAVRVVVENGQASASILQRRLRIGYARAARLVDMMESKGMVGSHEGSKPREVYITARQMDEIKKRSQEQ